MMKKLLLVGLFLAFALSVAEPVLAQPQGEPGGHGGPEMGAPPQGGPGGRPGKKDPAERAKREKMMSIRTTAEAYKSLSELYREQGKIDEAVAQLKKILDLVNVVENKEDPMISKQLGMVYMEIAEMYMSQNRLAEAEVILNEGIDKNKNSDTELSSRLALHLGQVLKKSGKTAEAEKCFQRVIELNAGKLTEKK